MATEKINVGWLTGTDGTKFAPMTLLSQIQNDSGTLLSTYLNSTYAKASHSHSIANITNLQSTLDGKAAASHSHSIANITNLQSTLDGKASASHSHSYLPLTGGTISGSTHMPLIINSGSNNEASIAYSYNSGADRWVVGPGAGYADFSKFGFYRDGYGALGYIDSSGNLNTKGSVYCYVAQAQEFHSVNNDVTWAIGGGAGSGDANIFGIWNSSTGMQASFWTNGTLSVNGPIISNGTIKTNNEWFRVIGNTGIYWETYGSGWQMYDSNYIRTVNKSAVLSYGYLACLNNDFVGQYRATSDNYSFIIRNDDNATHFMMTKGGDPYGLWRTDIFPVTINNSTCEITMNGKCVIPPSGQAAVRPNGASDSGNTSYSCGHPSYRWSAVYAANGTIQTSDRNLKQEIRSFTGVYEQLFYDLKPVIFKFKDNTSNRDHFGFISQDVEESLYKLGLNDKSFAGFCRDVKVDENENPILDENGNEQYIYSLRYEEFISLNTHMIQKVIAENNELKESLSKCEEKLSRLEKLIEGLCA